MICGYVRGGRQCSRPAVAALHHAVDHHQLQGKGYRLCLDHLTFVVGERPRPGLLTIVEWMD